MLQVAAPRRCEVCAKPTNSFNYGVQSCNACVMFFRRVVTKKNPVRECKNDGLCELLKFSNCRTCRYMKCLRVGMTKRPDNSPDSGHFELMENLLELDAHRRSRLTMYQVFEDPTVDEVIENFGCLKFILKPDHVKLSTYEWGFTEQLTAIDFLRRLEFTKKLDVDDFKILVKNAYFKFTLLINSYRAICSKSEEMTFPDGSDIIPEFMRHMAPAKFLIKVRSRLVGRMIELNVSHEEFLLVSVILFCNTALPISDSARTLVTKYQRIYTSALFQRCLITHQHSAPARLADLLSMCHVMNASYRDFFNLAFVMMIDAKKPIQQPKRVVLTSLQVTL